MRSAFPLLLKRRPTGLMFGCAVLALSLGAPGSAQQPAPKPSDPRLEAIRRGGDLGAQRAHVWRVFEDLVRGVTVDGAERPAFDSWRGEDQAFAPTSSPPDSDRGIRGFSRGETEAARSRSGGHGQLENTPLLSYTLYNDAAFAHLRANRLYQTAALERLRAGPASNEIVAGDRSVPTFPADAVVVKTAWWPVAHERATALPVWDPRDNPPGRIGNPYTSWKRVVAVTPAGRPAPGATQAIEFAGRRFDRAPQIGLDAFYSVPVDAGMAARMMREREAGKLAWVALGRPLEAGDRLLFVGANLATKEMADWVWGTVWWHDQPGQGAFAADRPAGLAGPWRNYLMQASFDSETPRAADGGPNITFNPWLEGRFPDNGQGGGAVSNCMECHRRASYPATPFLPVTRGPPDFKGDPAFAPGRLRTSFLWAIAMHSQPSAPNDNRPEKP